MTFEFTGYARAYEASESKALRLEWNSTEKFDYDGEFYQSGRLVECAARRPGTDPLRWRLRRRRARERKARRRVCVLGRAAGRNRGTDP